MKNIFYFLPFIALSFLTLTSCEDDSTDPLPSKVQGQFVKFNIVSKQLDYNNEGSSFFGGTLSVPSGNVARYELFIRRRTAGGVITSDYVPFRTVTSFPYELRVTTTDITQVFGLAESDLQDGEIYTFIAYSYDANGVRAGYRDLSRTLKVTATLKQGYRFNTTLTSHLAGPNDEPYNNNSPDLFTN